jgi:hypothetical protein
MNKSDSGDEWSASSPGTLEQREALLHRLALEIHHSSDVYEVTRVASDFSTFDANLIIRVNKAEDLWPH